MNDEFRDVKDIKITILESKLEILNTKNRILRFHRFMLLMLSITLYIIVLLLAMKMDKMVNLRYYVVESHDIQNEMLEVKQQIELLEYKEPIIVDYELFEVTGYCSCAKCCGKSDGITKSGVKAQANKTIAMDKSYPMGTEVLIEGFDGIVFEKQDIGGSIKGNKIDIYFDTHQEALNFGRKVLKVWILSSEVPE